jgi:hypothetical protein
LLGAYVIFVLGLVGMAVGLIGLLMGAKSPFGARPSKRIGHASPGQLSKSKGSRSR